MFKFITKKSASQMVAYAQKQYEKGKKMCYYVVLNGLGAGKLVTPPNDKHEYKLIIDAIHDYQAKFPEKNIKEGYNTALTLTINAIQNMEMLQCVLNYLSYELEKQKNNTSTFQLDYKQLLIELRNSISEKKDILRKQNKNFDKWMAHNMEELEQKCDKKR